jgi:6,7-dimethyl-8-ribityllumazine synthase
MNNKFAIIVSQFNESITNKLLSGCIERLSELGILSEQLDTFHVPGAVEIPLIAQQLAKTKQYQAIISLGAVIRGETSHYDYVCEQVSQGCQRVMLDFEVPVIFGVLTTENEAQAEARVGGHEGHKGRDAAETAFNMAALMRQLG